MVMIQCTAERVDSARGAAYSVDTSSDWIGASYDLTGVGHILTACFTSIALRAICGGSELRPQRFDGPRFLACKEEVTEPNRLTPIQ